jgi:ribonucleotide reductase beta subunit family protein with ferritin-like domain
MVNIQPIISHTETNYSGRMAAFLQENKNFWRYAIIQLFNDERVWFKLTYSRLHARN